MIAPFWRAAKYRPFWAVFLFAGAPAQAQGVLAHLHDTGTVTCAAEQRPGLAAPDAQGRLAGLALELCRAVAVAVLGPEGKAVFQVAGSQEEFAAIAAKPPDLVFLSGAAVADGRLSAALIPGPVVFIDPLTLLVPEASPAHAPADLAGKTICLMIGSPEQRAVEDALGRLRPAILRMTFREEVEMLDAYNAGDCDAMAGAATTLAGYRLTMGVNRVASRLIDPPLALTPVMAATPAGDGAWASLAGWILRDLIADAQPTSAWRGSQTLATLRTGWLDDVHRRVGTYGEMRARSLGEASRYRLAVWPNAPWPQGLLLPSQP